MSPADAEIVEAIAQRVVELLREAGGLDVEARYVDAATLAGQLGIDRDWVYRHAHQLGAIRLGQGPRGRLRFDRELVADRLAGADPESWRPPRRPPRRGSSGRKRNRRSSKPQPPAEPLHSKKVRRRASDSAPASPPKPQQTGDSPE